MIFNFGDTATVDRQVTADMQQAGGYYVLGRPGRFTIWASADKASRLAGSTGLATKPPAAERTRPVYLPAPPNRREKYEYFGRQRRWVFAFLLVAAAGVLYGYIRVAQHAWVVAPLMWHCSWL